MVLLGVPTDVCLAPLACPHISLICPGRSFLAPHSNGTSSSVIVEWTWIDSSCLLRVSWPCLMQDTPIVLCNLLSIMPCRRLSETSHHSGRGALCGRSVPCARRPAQLTCGTRQLCVR